ncbi:hypothetical protein [Fluviispira multicolorata]|uniref:Uncharacterized protein n=1 Tax=Fluviispira multicolorata TaxID=2654512 RepID=A0A833N5V6_9BACT|nr:hypothetical protein [Fluviispira multicolorata]KAB8028595.1 hypothetical protein GCL57_12820 [Fluviispira multicolorata]
MLSKFNNSKDDNFEYTILENEKIYSKESDIFYTEHISLSLEKFSNYYRPLVNSTSAFLTCLTYFSLLKTSKRLSNKEVFNFIVDIFHNYNNKEYLAEKINPNRKYDSKQNWNQFIGKEKLSVLKSYPEYISLKRTIEGHFRLLKSTTKLNQQDQLFKKEYTNHGTKEHFIKIYPSEYNLYNEKYKLIPGLYDKEKIVSSLKRLNEELIRESNKRNTSDRLDYYCTLNDMQIYSLFVSPIVGFHGIVFGLLIPPITGVGLVTTITATSIGTGIGTAKNHFSNFVKRIYNVGIRQNSFRKLDETKFNNKLNNAVNNNNLKQMSIIISELKKVNLKTGQFNFFFANTFKYYCELKNETDKYAKELFVEEKKFEKLLPNLQKLYYKTLCYFRKKEVLEETLRLQVCSLKAINIKSAFMIRNNENVKKFIRDHLNKDEGFQKKLIRKSIHKVCGKNAKNTELIEDIILLSLRTEEIDEKFIKENSISASLKAGLSEQIEDILGNFGSLNEGIKFGVRTTAKITPTDSLFTKISNNSTNFDLGLWLSISALEGILYLSESHKASRKYQLITSWISTLTGANYLSRVAASSVYLITSKWANLFTCPVMDYLYLNPFGIIADIFSLKIGGAVSSTHSENWRQIIIEFDDFKKKYSKDKWSPAYDYFIKSRPSDPSEVIHNIGDMYKNKLTSITTLVESINKDSLALLDTIQNFESSKSKSYFKTTLDDVINSYVKVFIKMFSLAKEIETFELYFEFLNEMNAEIETTLKINFTLLGVENKGVFSIIQFLSDPYVKKHILDKD